MNTSSFLSALRANPDLPLVFRAGDDIVAPGYHLTEVKRVAYETMDCGAMRHRWSETQFEIWVPAVAPLASGRGHMPAQKFLQIVDRVETELPLHPDATARIHATFGNQPAALYAITAVSVDEGQLRVELEPDTTRCKAAERRVASLTGGCCGSAPDTGQQEDAACCGSGPAQSERRAAACCA